MIVIPAKAGIQDTRVELDSGLRRDDEAGLGLRQSGLKKINILTLKQLKGHYIDHELQILRLHPA